MHKQLFPGHKKTMKKMPSSERQALLSSWMVTSMKRWKPPPGTAGSRGALSRWKPRGLEALEAAGLWTAGSRRFEPLEAGRRFQPLEAAGL